MVGYSLRETATGLMGEFIAASAVMAQGWSVSLCQQDGLDLVAFKDDCFIRIQVKTVNLTKATPGKSRCYHFNCGKGSSGKRILNVGDCDVLALCNPDSRLVLWMPIQQVCFKSRRVSPDAFTRRAEMDTWDRTIEKILEARR
jgi:hypothetical protein